MHAESKEKNPIPKVLCPDFDILLNVHLAYNSNQPWWECFPDDPLQILFLFQL
jgi:hypothetical protein